MDKTVYEFIPWDSAGDFKNIVMNNVYYYITVMIAEKGASFARQTEIVNCRLRDETPAAIIIKANIHIIL